MEKENETRSKTALLFLKKKLKNNKKKITCTIQVTRAPQFCLPFSSRSFTQRRGLLGLATWGAAPELSGLQGQRRAWWAARRAPLPPPPGPARCKGTTLHASRWWQSRSSQQWVYSSMSAAQPANQGREWTGKEPSMAPASTCTSEHKEPGRQPEPANAWGSRNRNAPGFIWLVLKFPTSFFWLGTISTIISAEKIHQNGAVSSVAEANPPPFTPVSGQTACSNDQ